MIKEEDLEGFFRSFRLALKSASLYPREHPAFRNSAEDLKEKTDLLLRSVPSLKIGFTSRSLVVEGKTLEKDKIWEELARFFHVRQILSLEIKQDITPEDWLGFVSVLSQTPREILRAGGIRRVLEREKIFSFAVEELDYSELLAAEGVEVGDVWPYLLSEAVREPSPKKIRQAARVFPRVLAGVGLAGLLGDRERGEDLGRFLGALRKEDWAEFQACAAAMVKITLKEKALPAEGELAGLREIFTGAEDQNFASILLHEMASADRFDTSTLETVFRLLGPEKCRRVAACLEGEMLKNITPFRESARFQERIQALLAGPPAPAVSLFRDALAAVFQQLSTHKRPALDRELLRASYRSMLLNILAGKADGETASISLASLLEEWPHITEEKDFDFLKLLFETLERKAEALSENPLFGRIRSKIADFIEKSLLSGEERPELEYILKRMPKSRLGVNYYLVTIFEENTITPAILRTFFHLFADGFFYFNLSLDQKKSDRRFLEKLTESLAEVDSPLSLATLKNIFSLGDDAIKVKALRAMRNLSTCDETFLYPLLRKAASPQKREALLILKKEPGTQKKALRILLLRRSPFGLRNSVLLEHLRIVEDLKLREAAECVTRLRQRRFFWNKKLRREAGNLLRKWNLG